MALLSISYSVCNAQVTATGQLDPTQVYTTNNIVQNTPQGGPTPWVNGVYQDSLTCWAWGNPGYCGPNAIVRPGNNINFSFGTTDLYQSQAIANILPNTGSGLRVNGYNFSFTAKNGNGWDDGRVDSLYAYVHLKDSGNRLLEYDTYNLNYQFNWTTFNYSKNFTTPYSAPTLGNVTYGFVGRDNNGWAGPYGPEINNVSFSLKYSVDPCSVDPLSSPSCPGYLDALAKLTPPAPTASVTYESPTTITSAPIVTTTSSVSTPTSTTEAVAPTPVATSTSSGSTAGTGTPTTSVASVSTTPSATNPQPKAGEIQTSSAPAPTQKSTVSTSQILSIVAGEQSRIANVEKSVVQEAVQQAQAAGASATAQAESVAATAQSQSIASSSVQSTSTTTTTGLSNVGQSQGGSIALRGNTPTTVDVTGLGRLQSSGNESSSSTLTNSYAINFSGVQQYQQGIRSNSTIVSVTAPVVSNNFFLSRPVTPVTEFEIRSNEIKIGDRGVIDLLQSRPIETQQQNISRTPETVNKNAKDNDAAGGVKIASIATQPVGYESYFGVIVDRPFYPPKEIYRNQRVVDNARLMRGLQGSGDRLHQEMVDSQYNRGN